jgi:hypothetical protein
MNRRPRPRLGMGRGLHLFGDNLDMRIREVSFAGNCLPAIAVANERVPFHAEIVAGTPSAAN